MNVSGKKTLADSPCIGICSTALGDAVCIGCGRTFEEVIQWNTMNDDEKCKVNLRLQKERQKIKTTS